jgi:hypothetical protein
LTPSRLAHACCNHPGPSLIIFYSTKTGCGPENPIKWCNG